MEKRKNAFWAFSKWVILGIGGALLSAVVGWFTPLGEPARNWSLDQIRSLTSPLPDEFADLDYVIYVADFAGDDVSRTQARRLHEALARQFPSAGTVKIARMPRAIRLGDERPSTRARAEARGRDLLSRTAGDVLIWGEVRPLNDEIVIRILGASASNDVFLGLRDQSIRTNLAVEIAPVIAATIASDVRSVGPYGQYVEQTLRPIVERVAALLAASPDWMTGEVRGRVLHAFGNATARLGEETGAQDSFRTAIGAYRQALDIRSPERDPGEWAATQDALCITHRELGELEGSATQFQSAVEACELALTARTVAAFPLGWAASKVNLANALTRLAERENSAARFEEALTHYEEAQSVLTRQAHPSHWGQIQRNIGVTLYALSAFEAGTSRLEAAISAYRLALEELTRERVPMDWSATQHNLGVALGALGERQSGSGEFRAAVEAFRSALLERRRDRSPVAWADSQDGLARALMALGASERSTAVLEDAVEAFELALQEYSRERTPLRWAGCQSGLGQALKSLAMFTGLHDSNAAMRHLDASIAALNRALAVHTVEAYPLDWALTQLTLGEALELQSVILGPAGQAEAETALATFVAARDVFRRYGYLQFVPSAEAAIARISRALQ